MISCICLGIGELFAFGIASLLGLLAGRKQTAVCEHAHACAHTCEHDPTVAKPRKSTGLRRWVERRYELRQISLRSEGAPHLRAAVRRSLLVVLAVILFGALFAVAAVELDPKHHHGEEEADHAESVHTSATE